MHAKYEDIRALTSEPPSWFDENGVPRYGEFAPHRAANIYAHEVALAEIECQACSTRFNVAFTELNAYDDLKYARATKKLDPTLPFPKIAELIESRSLHYGDPPNVECCASGPTMDSIPIRVLEYWFKLDITSAMALAATGQDFATAIGFQRNPAFEKDIQQD